MKLGLFSALADRSYRTFALGSAISVVGIWMQRVAVAWLTWDLSQSTIWLGAVAAADLAPAVFLSPVSGWLADMYERIRLLRWAQSVAILQSLVLAVLTWAGVASVEALFVLTLIVGIANSIEQPARLALIRDIVPPNHLYAAVTFNSLTFNLARFIGPVAAGYLISELDIGMAFVASAIAIAIFSYGLAGIDHSRLATGSVPGERPLDAVRAGYRYSYENRAVLKTMIVVLITGAGIGGLVQQLPAIADTVYARGLDGFVELTAASSLGSVISGLVLLFVPPRTDTFFNIAASMVVAAAALAVFVWSSSYAVGIVSILIMSFAMTQAGVTSQSILQIESGPNMLGRVMGIYSLLVRGSPAIGAFLIGWIADSAGFFPPVMAFAVATAAYGFCLIFIWR